MHYISNQRSQPATQQDIWVAAALGFKRDGTFVECGAFDGLHHSNTYYLEHELGWTGLLVEADPELHKQSTINRPHCRHCEVALSKFDDQCQWARFSSAGQWGGLVAYLPDAWIKEHYRRHTKINMVSTLTLRTVLSIFKMPYWIDYLSLDIEGAEFPVLERYFREPPKHVFRGMTIEYREDAGELMQLCRLLEPHGYRLAKTQAWDAFFLHESVV